MNGLKNILASFLSVPELPSYCFKKVKVKSCEERMSEVSFKTHEEKTTISDQQRDERLKNLRLPWDEEYFEVNRHETSPPTEEEIEDWAIRSQPLPKRSAEEQNAMKEWKTRAKTDLKVKTHLNKGGTTVSNVFNGYSDHLKRLRDQGTWTIREDGSMSWNPNQMED